ncbi:glycosyltransferase 8 domain-containing protein 1-like isoform X2 [Acipenser ruthenus]|uniref:glycosyltransferase 8 domain-containing protein 1-like isoform X2 n=1 Tax=Acipenser ruthenus TaxID=7906 RepID=UPI0027420716|nr:glycosyltransferase 8 domain-containing protein 1-like isoform X2 [Acipenser ruthenus]
MTFRKINVVILLLIAVAFLIIVHRNLISLNDFLRSVSSDSHHMGLQPIDFLIEAPQRLEVARTGEEVPVVITAAGERLGALIAAMNSIYSNTKSNVVFHIVTMNDTADHLKNWLSKTGLKDIKYRIVQFDPRVLEGKIRHNPVESEPLKPLTFARFFLPTFVPDGKKAIYLDDDVIVQGDIQELYNTKLKTGHAVAFSDDCDSASLKGLVRGAGNQYNYIGFLDYKKDSIRKLGMKATTCSFNPGVFVANLTEWKRQNITKQLEKWMEVNVAFHWCWKPLFISVCESSQTASLEWSLQTLGEDIFIHRHLGQMVHPRSNRQVSSSTETHRRQISLHDLRSLLSLQCVISNFSGQFFPPDQDDYSGIWYCL